MISFRPKKTGPRPLVTVREMYDKTCAVERAVGELQRTLDGRAAQRSHVLRYLGIAAVLTPLFWRLETYALGCRWLVSSGIIRDTVQVVTLFSVAIGLGLVLLDIAWPRLRRWLFESPQPVRKRRSRAHQGRRTGSAAALVTFPGLPPTLPCMKRGSPSAQAPFRPVRYPPSLLQTPPPRGAPPRRRSPVPVCANPSAAPAR